MESLLLQDVYKIYKEGDIETVALRGANLVVQPGEFVAITGRSGAGKSTLLNIMGGLAVPSAGKVLINGLDIAKMGESERSLFRRQNIGVIFQTDNLITFLTALENVMLPLQFAGRRQCTEEPRNLLSEVGLQNRFHHKPGMLSGGERQRVAIAIALANHPGLLLADELTGELDTATAEQVMTLLAGLNSQRNLTLIIVTHNKVVANRANRQVHIMDGQLTEITNQIARN